MSRTVASEAKPWETLNTDGRPNMGSYEVGGALDVAKLVHRLYLDEHHEPGTREQLNYLTVTLLCAVDEAQHRITGRTDRQAASHRHAYRAIVAALDAYPVPWGADPDTRAAWYRALVDRGAMLLEIARDLIHPDR